MSPRLHFLDHRVPPPLLLLGFGVATATLVGRLPPLALTLPAGALLVLAGAALAVWGVRTFRAARTTIDPVTIDRATTVVSAGPFARTRNPMYVGFTLMLLGWVVALGSLPALAAPVLFTAWLHRFQVHPEERAMRARFGAAWQAYAEQVPRWI